MQKVIKSTFKLYIVLVLIFLASQNIFAITNFVGKFDTPIGNYYTNIQSAISSASAGDFVIVSNGIYSSGATITPGHSSSNRIVITANITVKSVSGPKNTIILGKGPRGNAAVRGVYLSAGVLSGFTISNGHTRINGDFYYDLQGGGANMYGGNGLITNCTIIRNSAVERGGGASYGTINNSTISENSAADGGGTYYSTVNNSIIIRNSTEQRGGGTFYGTINNSIINGNTASEGGGNYNCTINNSTISENSASEGGGSYYSTNNNSAISENTANYGGGTSYGIINNCTIIRNTSKNSGGGTYGSSVNNSIIYYNSAQNYPNRRQGTYNYSCTTADGTNGTFNIYTEPKLVNFSHIGTNSPCIGAGSISYTSGVDIDGESWKDPPSMGCDEIYANALTGSLSVTIIAAKTIAYPNVSLTFSAEIEGKQSLNIWTFGDGTAETNKFETTHSWSEVGEYDVIVTAFNETYPVGISDSISISIFTNVHYVNINNVSPIPPYSFWNTAATNIQDAVDVSLNSGTIFVTNGIYSVGTTVTPGYSSSNRVVITNNITVKSVNGPEDTIIVGKGPRGDSAVRGVYMSDGILSGFTVSDGHTTTNGNNNYDQNGGGVNMFGGNGIITNCTISENVAANGGGIAYGTIKNSTISRNLATLYGGGTSEGLVNNCAINGNTAFNSGGGTYSSTVNNSTIIGNSAADYGGGTSESTINNCIIWDNTASIASINFYNDVIKYSCSSPQPTGVGNISAEPMLLNFSHIGTNSPCIGAGSISYTSGVDIDGEPWKDPPSMGCDEVYANALTGSLSVVLTAAETNTFIGNPLTFSVKIEGRQSLNIWTFGDGTAETNKFETTHSWSDVGEYDVVVTAFNETYPSGISNSISISVLTNFHYVNINNFSPLPPYLSWKTAATNIQDAVDIALDAGTIFVTNGIYSVGETVTPENSSSNRVAITRNIIVTSVNGPENTIIVGKGPRGDSAVRGVYISSGILSGFTVSNGHTMAEGNDNYDLCGGGINMFGGSGIITNCTIIGNSARINGGGTAYGTVNNCTISGNLATLYGGGTCESIINNCTIKGNSGTWGGGTYKSTINNCTISENTAVDGGGIFYATANNCTINENSATWSGGGAYQSTINNCTISENYAIKNGGGIYGSTANNCIIWYNSAPQNPNFYGATISYSCSSPLPDGEGNFDSNPILLSSSHISLSSPCIGKGTNFYATGTDIDGELWKDPPSVGCDEIYTNDLTGDLLVDIYAEYTSAVVGAELEFKSIIVGKPSSNSWTFSDGSSSSDNYFINHSFSAVGEYEVILSAFNEDNPAGVAATVMVNIVNLDNATYYVNKANSTPAFPYNSWSTAASNIQDAVNATLLKNGLVLVTNGIYDTGETVTPKNSSSNRVVITADIIVKSVNGPENTMIFGKGPLGSNAVRGVYMSMGTLDGFTVSNGHTSTSGSFNYDSDGGGINLYGGNAVVTNCVIIGNMANKDGGGICYGTINNCTLSGNSADYGGGTCYSTVNNCVINENSADNGGGTCYSTINNCTISGNTANDYAGGTFDCKATNSIIYYNYAQNYNNKYQGTYSYCCTTPNPGDIGNITSVPLLNANYRLEAVSPCINAGTNLPWMTGATDLAGAPRIVDGIVDMGCYEFVLAPQITTNALIFPEKNSIIFANQLTNIIWDAEKITDDTDGTNLTITKIDLHYADTTNFILQVTNNIANTSGEIEWYIPPGSWDGLTNYVLKFEVVDSSSLTNSRIFWDNEFVIVPEGGIIFSILFLVGARALVCIFRKGN